MTIFSSDLNLLRRTSLGWILATILVGAILSAVASGRDPKPTFAPKPAAAQDDVAVYFSPDGGAAQAVIFLIEQARRNIRMQAFMFTHDGIRDALIDAHQRGVEIEVVLDRDNADVKGSARRGLRRAGITVYIPRADMRMHNKVILIDEKIIVTGSFNFTFWADSKNAENLLILKNKPRLVNAYMKSHEHLKRLSRKYETKKKR